MTGSDKLVTDPLELTGQSMDETMFLTRLVDTDSTYAEYLLHKLKFRLQFYLGVQPEATLKCYQVFRAKRFQKQLRCDFGDMQGDFYAALSAIDTYRLSGKKWQLRLAGRLLKRLKKIVKDGNINCVHMIQLLAAEKLALKKPIKKVSPVEHRRQVGRAFDLAISSASGCGFSNDAGVAHERAAVYYSLFDQQHADYHWTQAVEQYADWGAWQKVELMIELHPCLSEFENLKSTTNLGSLGSSVLVRDSCNSGGSTRRATCKGGRLKERRRYEAEAARQHQSLHNW